MRVAVDHYSHDVVSDIAVMYRKSLHMLQVAESNMSRKDIFAARFWDQVHRKVIPTIEKSIKKGILRVVW